MSAYTPGPWKVVEDWRSGRNYAEPEELVGYNITGPNGSDIVGEEGINASDDSNAYLIAAAPELLAALMEYVALGSGKCTIGKPAVAMARAAIAKATGVQP